jgi:hypothetical protein
VKKSTRNKKKCVRYFWLILFGFYKELYLIFQFEITKKPFFRQWIIRRKKNMSMNIYNILLFPYFYNV